MSRDSDWEWLVRTKHQRFSSQSAEPCSSWRGKGRKGAAFYYSCNWLSPGAHETNPTISLTQELLFWTMTHVGLKSLHFGKTASPFLPGWCSWVLSCPGCISELLQAIQQWPSSYQLWPRFSSGRDEDWGGDSGIWGRRAKRCCLEDAERSVTHL